MKHLNIRVERLKRGWTQGYVGQCVGVSKVSIHEIETGKQHPSYGVLLKLLKLFDVEHKNLTQLFAPVEETQENSNMEGEEQEIIPEVAAAELSEITSSSMVRAAADFRDGKADTAEGRRVLELMRQTGGAALVNG